MTELREPPPRPGVGSAAEQSVSGQAQHGKYSGMIVVSIAMLFVCRVLIQAGGSSDTDKSSVGRHVNSPKRQQT